MKKKMIALAALLLAVVVTGYSVSGTYAKYTSKVGTGTESARVAKWFDKKDDNVVTLDVFDNSKFSPDTISEDVIAPGTYGVIELALPANLDEVLKTSSVEVAYTLVPSITITDGTGGHIHFWISETETLQEEDTASPETVYYDTNTNNLTKLGEAISEAMTVNAKPKESIATAQASKQSKQYLHWAWKFEDSADSADTSLGEAGSATVELKLDLTATQVKPTEVE